MVKIGERLGMGLTVIAVLLVVACSDKSSPPTGPEDYLTVAKSSSSSEENKLFAAVRQATAKYQNIDVARASGYVDDGFGCFSDPVLGGMGWHLIHDPLHADPAIDPLKPELLVYEPGKGGHMKLVALEYEVYQADWQNAGNIGLPSLFGQEFEALEIPGIDPLYGLHLWLWRDNPAGMFAPFNSRVVCP
jgi:hypothetical protein